MANKVLFSIAAAAFLAACGGSSSGGGGTTTGQITLSGTGFTPHVGETLRAALVRVSDGAILDLQKTTVPAGGTFSFTFTPTVDLSAAYKVRYWADHANTDVCDAPPVDHQWEADVTAGQASLSVTHNTTFTDVCSTFTFPLTFEGGTGFNTAHPGQDYHVALVKGTAATALEPPKSSTIASTVPGFSVTFDSMLIINEAYSVKLWVDNNTTSGVGVCDLPPTDHQWSVNIDSGLSNHPTLVSYNHNTTFADPTVCTFFGP